MLERSVPGLPVVFPDPLSIQRLHDRIIERVGGASGLRDLNLLLGAWARVETSLFYDRDLDTIDVAARLAVSIVKAHAFVDGNKRAAHGALAMTFAMNGFHLSAAPEDTCRAIVAAAAAPDGVADFTAWLRGHARPDPVYQALFDHDRGLQQDGDDVDPRP
ncbi:type II toxin-antitoxin system death-on-curing family toxin [Cereibacter sphaeroides]|uniref:type II toxin-antitoxin system death-on-curing family toxin n=1 Tax=Cereibacter sphaeroides TaxID=1063 RepID=UPI001EFF59CA|nr:type II toxin-antitoxin system death-on-curing family toxin [Cereibacter sphaeroides]MCE6958048.1 type II toxin-antitoxin system death-on-curing family toxin [Cereibacter sphaeroides]MCE6971359.1 type II toxin-antitoxin system death-on-curing family toxin [Cereibacter sphaeroides]